MATISYNDIARAIYLLGKGKSGSALHNILLNAVNFLYRRNLLSKSEQILNHLKKIANQDAGIAEVKIWSKHKLNSEVKKDLKHIFKKRYGKKAFVFEEVVDEKVLGGFKIEINDEMIDLTLRNKLYKLQEYLNRNV